MTAAQAFSYLFLKDLRKTYRQKTAIIAHILFVCVFVPVVWLALSFLYRGVLSLDFQTPPSPEGKNETAVNVLANLSHLSVSIKRPPHALWPQWDTFVDQIDLFCPFLDVQTTQMRSDNVSVTVNVTDLDLVGKQLHYELILQQTNRSYENPTYFYPTLFGPVSPNFSPVSASADLAAVQMCVNLAFDRMANLRDYRPHELFLHHLRHPSVPSAAETTRVVFNVVRVAAPALLLAPVLLSLMDFGGERTANIHTYLIAVGVPRCVHYGTTMFFGVCRVWFTAILFSLPMAVFFPPVGVWALFVIVMLGQVQTNLVFFVSTLFAHAWQAFGCAVVLLALLTAIHVSLAPLITVWAPLNALLLALLNPVSAYAFAFDHLLLCVEFDLPVAWFAWKPFLPLSVALGALVVHAVVLTLLGYYTDAVLPIDESPKSRPFCCLQRNHEPIVDPTDLPPGRDKVIPPEGPSEMQVSSFEEDRGLFAPWFEFDGSGHCAEIEVNRLVKKWQSGEVALKGVSFRAYTGEVTALLGPRGAGKSTLFSVLSGFTSASAGIVRVAGDLPGVDMAMVGWAPSWDPLFPYMTVEEHLAFIGRLKTHDHLLNEDILEVLEVIALKGERKMQARHLSTSMRRRLCLGMALIGGSTTVLLDEPTRGMDALGRRAMLKTINGAKAHRAILLTAPSMDEADFFSDRILVLSKGELLCNGSDDFMNARNGTGLVLTVTLDEEAKAHEFGLLIANVLELAIKHCEGTRIHGPLEREFKLVLPMDKSAVLPALFADLDTHASDLHVMDFDLSINSLEQGFLRVIEDNQPVKQEFDFADAIDKLQEVRSELFTGYHLFAMQLQALLYRRWLFARRRVIHFLMPFFLLCPLVAVLALLPSPPGLRQGTVPLRLTSFPPFTAALIHHYGDGPMTEPLAIALNSSANVRYRHFARNESEPVEALTGRLEPLLRDMPPLGFAISTGPIEPLLNRSVRYDLFYQDLFANGVQMALALIAKVLDANAIIKTSVKIEASRVPKPLEAADGPLAIPMLVLVLVSVFFGQRTLRHVAERSMIRLLIPPSSLSMLLYWSAAFLMDFVIALPMLGILVALLHTFELAPAYCEAALFIGIGSAVPAFLCQAYFASLLFRSGVHAFSAVQAVNLVAYVCVCVPLAFVNHGSSLQLLGSIFPSHAVFMTLRPLPHCSYLPGASGLISSALWAFVLAVAHQRHRFSCFWWRRVPHVAPSLGKEDEDAIEERSRASVAEPDECAVLVRRLKKVFRRKAAINDLNVAVGFGEAFGLLGVTGSGKTTTLHLLMGVQKPSAGTATIRSVSCRNNPQLGYMPVRDALLSELTVRENLIFFAKLNGIKNFNVAASIVLDICRLTSRANLLVRKCSFADRRWASLAVALLTDEQMLLLDEPSVGLDTDSKHRMWQFLRALRAQAGSTIVVATRSQTEVDALCTRVAVLHEGAFVTVGTPASVRERLEGCLLLSLRLAEPNEDVAVRLDAAVRTIFSASPVIVAGSVPDLCWLVPRSQEPLSVTHARLVTFVNEEAKTPGGRKAVVEFSLVAASLDLVLLKMEKARL